MGKSAVLIVPEIKAGFGGGHFNRCLFLLDALEESGFQPYIWIPQRYKDDVFLRLKNLMYNFNNASLNDSSDKPPKNMRSLYARLLTRKSEVFKRTWAYIVIDKFKTEEKEFIFWRKRAPVIGIDEGGKARAKFDFLIDILPAPNKIPANINMPSLLPLPKNRRKKNTIEKAPLRILISFGAEDSKELGFFAARALAKNCAKNCKEEITFIAPNWNYASVKHRQLGNVTVLDSIPNLKEHLAGYDLFITHYGIAAFEAIYASVPVLIVSPSAYHQKLSHYAGFYSLGIGAKAAKRLSRFHLNKTMIETLTRRCEKIAKRFALDGDQKEDLSTFLRSISPHAFRQCPLCGEKIKQKKALVRFFYKTYFRCNNCQVVFLNRLIPPEISYDENYFFEVYKKQYGKTYLEDFPSLIKTADKRLRSIVAAGKINDNITPRLFDIGCAYGAFLKAAKEFGFACFGVDPIPDAVRYVNEELKISAWQGFFPSGSKAEDGPFDVVTMWFVIEHFKDPFMILNEIKRILKPGGVFAFSTPSISGISGRKSIKDFLRKSPEDHYTVLSPSTCKKVLKHFGFVVKKIVVTGHHPQRFPLFGRFVRQGEKGFFFKALLAVSRLFRLGDTFEVYAVKER